ncbi:MAG: hypothetical protein ABFR47_01185, partial [Verrucomicrobiota bacterium]
MYFEKIKISPQRTVTILLASFVFLTGCTDMTKPATDAKSAMAQATYFLKKANRTPNPKIRIKFLRHAFDNAELLDTKWPDFEKPSAFLEKYGDKLASVPDQVYELSMQTRDMESFTWAIAHSNKDYTQHTELLRAWKMGKQWRDYFISEYPEKALSIFMNEALREYNVRFFNQYIDPFKASGYRVEFPLEKTEFNTRFCRFFAEEFRIAIKKGDTKRVEFLIDHMPAHNSAPIIAPKTEEIMRNLADYICHELKDEALACKLVDLGYDMGRIDIDKTGFGADFSKALVADLEHAVIHVLKLNEWHGPLSEKETRFVLFLPNPALRQVHKRHLAEAIKTSIENTKTKDALRLIKVGEKVDPSTPFDYNQILGWSLEYKNRSVFNYVKPKCPRIDPYQVDLAQLAKTPSLFRLHAPKIFRRIYPTMETTPKKDGTTYGRIRDLLRSHRPEAALYVVKNHDLGDEWTELTGGRTLLMDVCEGGNLEAAKFLVERKRANVLTETDYIESNITLFGRAKVKEGRLSPIFFAAQS